MSEATQTPTHQQMATQSDTTKLAFWFFLGGEITLFATLILMFVVMRRIHAADYASFKAELNIPLVGLNTFVLIVSSYLVVRALQAIQQKHLRNALLTLVIVLGLGAIFIGGQAYEWSTLFGKGINLQSTFGSPFFIITGIHGMHVLVGLAWTSFLLIHYATINPTRLEDRPIELFGLYWHFVDIVWIILFSLIYLV